MVEEGLFPLPYRKKISGSISLWSFHGVLPLFKYKTVNWTILNDHGYEGECLTHAHVVPL